MPRRTLASRFWLKVGRAGPDECWPWIAYCNPLGYGNFQIGDRPRLAHRVAFELTRGPIPPGLCVLHSCDNPPCCNPAHLWLGTPEENMADRDRKGRTARGEDKAAAKLNPAAVQQIRQRAAMGESQRALGRDFGVTQQAIYRAIHRLSWRHVP